MNKRDLSSQRLVHYLKTWRFDVDCYDYDKFRRFAWAAGENVVVVEIRTKDEAVNMQKAEFDGYRAHGVLPGDEWRDSTGIFVTTADSTAKPSMARASRQRLHWSPAEMQAHVTYSHCCQATD